VSMFDIDFVAQLENKALLDRLEAEKSRQRDDQKNHREHHAKVLLEIEAGKAEAEKEIPALLKRLQEEIAYAIQYKKYNVEFNCGSNGYREEWKLLHIKILLCQMLPLKGLACKLSSDDFGTVIVSW